MVAGELTMPKTWWDRLPGVGQRPMFLPELEHNTSAFQEVTCAPQHLLLLQSMHPHHSWTSVSACVPFTDGDT